MSRARGVAAAATLDIGSHSGWTGFMNNQEITMHKPPTSGARRGVPGLTLCLRCPSRCTPRSAQCLTGQPPRYTVPVRLFRPRGRPPACHRRGRSPLPSPPRDRADGATLGRPRHQPRRTRRPTFRDVTPRGSSPAFEDGPLSLGHATPPAARLMGRRDARPHTMRTRRPAPRDAG